MLLLQHRPLAVAECCAFLCLVLAPSVGAQNFKQDISLAGLGNGNAARPFGITAEPDTQRLFVAIAGDFFNNNNVVAILDPVTDSVTGTIPVGLFPEDIAFVYDSSGKALYGAVTNSSDGTVTLWDAQTDQVLSTVLLPDPFQFGTCFPFGITVADTGSHLYVGTVDGSGDIHAILLTNAPNFSYDSAASFNVGLRSIGRLRHLNSFAFAPTSTFDAFFTGAEGGITGWSTGVIPSSWQLSLVDKSGQFEFPGGQDLEVLADGSLVLGGTFFDNRLYLLDQSGTLDRTIRLSSDSGSAHGLALNSDESLLAVCDLAGNQLVLVDMINREEFSVTALPTVGQGYQQPNEAVFFLDKLYVTAQANEEVLVFDGLPTITPGGGFAGTLTVSEPAPALGSTTTVTVTGSGKVALVASEDDLPGNYSGLDLEIGPTHTLIGVGQSSFSKVFQIPNKSELHAQNVFFQGVVDVTNSPQGTAPKVVILQ